MNLKLKSHMNERELALLGSEMALKKKSVVVAYLLLFWFGWFGLHQWYLRNVVSACLYVIPFGLLGASLSFYLWPREISGLPFQLNNAELVKIAFVSSILAGGVVLVMLIYDVFTLVLQTGQSNERIEHQIANMIIADPKKSA